MFFNKHVQFINVPTYNHNFKQDSRYNKAFKLVMIFILILIITSIA